MKGTLLFPCKNELNNIAYVQPYIALYIITYDVVDYVYASGENHINNV